MRVFCDNQSGINITKNLVSHDRTKNVEIDHHFVKYKIDENIVDLPHILRG